MADSTGCRGKAAPPRGPAGQDACGAQRPWVARPRRPGRRLGRDRVQPPARSDARRRRRRGARPDATDTYADLDERADRTARAPGPRVGCGDAVAAVSRNRVELVDLYFATGKTGSLLVALSHRIAEQVLAAVVDGVDPAADVVETPFEADLIDALGRSDADPTDDDHRREPLVTDVDDAGGLEAVEAALWPAPTVVHQLLDRDAEGDGT